MEFNFLESLLYGLIAGVTDILPISAQAHKSILMMLFGVDKEPTLLRTLIHAATLSALIYCNQSYLRRMIRQVKLSRIPKKRRKRPLDMRTILDYRLLQTMLIPLILGFLFYSKAAQLQSGLNWIALFSLVNAVILFFPQMLPSANKDARTMTRVESLSMGLGAAAGVVPGISSMGCMLSVASACGADRTYAVNIAVLMYIPITALLLVYDILSILTVGFIGTMGLGILLSYILAAVTAFIGVVLAIRIIRSLAAHTGFTLFAWYSLSVAILSFVLYLMV